MKLVEVFIKEKGVNVIEMENKLGIPARTIRIDRSVPKKYMDSVVNYLRDHYGFDKENPDVEVDVPVPIKPEKELKRVWNKNFKPEYKDGVIRYQDPDNGLWKRLWDWQGYVEKIKDSSGKEIVQRRRIKEPFLPLTGEVLSDDIGEYYVAKNGIKVYSFRGDLSKIE